MATNHETVCYNFVRGIKSTGSNVYSDYKYGGKDLRLYSYGSHFVLAVKLNKPNHNTTFLLNGDTYSVSTAKHQGHARFACRNQGMAIIPFSSLQSAGIGNDELENISILDRTEEKRVFVPYIDPKTGEQKEREEHLLGSTLFYFKNRYYLSSTDSSAKSSGRGFFLVQLPRACKSVAMAYDLLKPKAVLEDTPYTRQGEFFFVPCPTLTTKDIVAKGPKYKPQSRRYSAWKYKTGVAKSDLDRILKESGLTLDQMKENTIKDYEVRGDKIEIVETEDSIDIKFKHLLRNRFPCMKGHIIKGHNIARIYSSTSGNAHSARDCIIINKGEVYVRGCISHPEHTRVNLGEMWHRVHINRAVNSWSTDGRVD